MGSFAVEYKNGGMKFVNMYFFTLPLHLESQTTHAVNLPTK